MELLFTKVMARKGSSRALDCIQPRVSDEDGRRSFGRGSHGPVVVTGHGVGGRSVVDEVGSLGGGWSIGECLEREGTKISRNDLKGIESGMNILDESRGL